MTSTQRARRFRSRRDAEAARPRLDATCSIPLDQFADLIGDYDLPKAEWVRCQLEEKGSICRQLHGRGWIAKRKDGAEGLIGHDCAEDHFGADERFAARFFAARSRVDREIRTDTLIERLAKLLADPKVSATLDAAMRRQQRLSDRIMDLRNRWPGQLRSILIDRSKRGDAGVMINIRHVEWDPEKKRDKVRMVPDVWGVLAGLQALETGPILKIGKRLSEAQAALAQATASMDQPEASMQGWASALEYLERCDRELDEQQAEVEAFCRTDNLKLLWLLTRIRVDQIAFAHAALELASRRRVTDAEVAAAMHAWSEEIKTAHGSRDFEIVA